MNSAAEVAAPGSLVFRLELPLELAPTFNTYASKIRIRGKNGHRFWLKKLDERLDGVIGAEVLRWPAAVQCDIVRRVEPLKGPDGKWLMTKGRRPRVRTKTTVTGGRRRRVVVTRHSSVEPDDISCDVVGGKALLDRLKHADVLRDDNRKWCEREARWEYAPPKHGRVVIEVFEMEDER